MASIVRLGLVIVLGLAVGCSRDGASAPAATAAKDGGNIADAGQVDYSNNPIAQVASEFLDSVLKGDTKRGSAQLTPTAMEKIVASGKQFDPPGVENPRFRIVGVGVPAEDRAFVQCEINYTAQGSVHNESMCCELRLVNNSWRVSGFAYGASPDKWVLHDFETDRDTPVQMQTSGPNAVAPQNAGVANRPSPPRTAQEAPAISPTAERR
jgi:hypothetical protein